MDTAAPDDATFADAGAIPVAVAVAVGRRDGGTAGRIGPGGDDRPVAVVDAGVGGAGVAAAIRRRLPGERVVYVARAGVADGGCAGAARGAAGRLGAKHVVVCGASPLHVGLSFGLSGVGVSGPIDPAARSAVRAAGASRRPTVAVLAAESEVPARAYEHAVARRRQLAALLVQPAPLLAAMAEDGRSAGDPLLKLAVRQYLKPLLERRPTVLLVAGSADPELLEAVRAGAARLFDEATERATLRGTRRPRRLAVIDAASACADDVARRLADAGRLAPPASGTTDRDSGDDAGTPGGLRVLTFAGPGPTSDARFADLAARTFGVEGATIEALDPDAFDDRTPGDDRRADPIPLRASA